MAQIIQQGSTPTHKFTTPYKSDSVQNAIISYWQNGYKLQDIFNAIKNI